MTVKFTFGQYSDSLYTDWYDVDNRGVDAEAFLLTGFLTGGDTQRNKQVVYQTTHFGKVDGSKGSFFLTSKPFPLYEYFSEVLGVTVALPEAELRKVIDEYEWSDAARILVSLPEAELRSIVVTQEVSDAMTIGVSLPEAELKSVAITLERPVDPMFISVALPEAELKKTGITYEPPREDFQITVDLPEAELALV